MLKSEFSSIVLINTVNYHKNPTSEWSLNPNWHFQLLESCLQVLYFILTYYVKVRKYQKEILVSLHLPKFVKAEFMREGIWAFFSCCMHPHFLALIWLHLTCFFIDFVNFIYPRKKHLETVSFALQMDKVDICSEETTKVWKNFPILFDVT